MKIDVKHIAKLANLSLKADEIKKFEQQLLRVLEYVRKLEEVDVKNIKITSQVTGLENVTRNDTVSPSLSQEKSVTNTKKVHNGLFVVKAIFE